MEGSVGVRSARYAAVFLIMMSNLLLDRLTPDGVVSLSRRYFSPQPGETLRMVSLAAAVLRRAGAALPQDRLFLARSGQPLLSTATLLIAARPFTTEELDTLRRWCAARGFEELLGPGFSQGEALAQLAGGLEPAAFLDAFPLDLSPPTDDRPFFFNMLRVRDVVRAGWAKSTIFSTNADAVVTLGWLLVVAMGLSVVFILVPLWLRGAATRRVPRTTSRLTYFAGLGFGFIVIEVSLMQRLMIVLGHPVYGLTVVLFSLLVAAGAGSLWTQRASQRGRNARWLRRALLVLLLVAGLTASGGVLIARTLESAPTWLRITGAVLVLVPLGFVLGIPLATGLALSASDPLGHRALYWGVNGAASVCGSVVATIISLNFGITVSYAVGLLAYAMAAVASGFAFPVEPVVVESVAPASEAAA